MIPTLGRDWFGLADFDPGAERRGWLYLLDEVGSTSDFLLGRGEPALGRLCRWDGWGWQAGEKQPLRPPTDARPDCVAVARRQVAGRGRMGRRWFGRGGLMMSWSVEPPSPPVAGLAVWTGVVAAQALTRLTGSQVRLKWPNDLRLDGRKLGGILLDLVLQGPRPRLVAGLGLNVGSLPPDLPDDARARAAALPTAPARWSTLADLAGAVLRRWDAEVGAFLAGGWAVWSDAFDAIDELAGRRVRLDGAGEAVAGIACGIDANGALLLKGPDGGIVPALAGDVHVLDVGPPAGEA